MTSQALMRRVARLEAERQSCGDWRQFGHDPRDLPDWALLARSLWEMENQPELNDRAAVLEARRLYDAGEIDAAFGSLQPILVEHRRIIAVSVQRG